MDGLKSFGLSFQMKNVPDNFHLILAVWFQVIKQRSSHSFVLQKKCSEKLHQIFRKKSVMKFFSSKTTGPRPKIFSKKDSTKDFMKFFKITSQLLENPLWNVPTQSCEYFRNIIFHMLFDVVSIYVASFYLSCIYCNI